MLFRLVQRFFVHPDDLLRLDETKVGELGVHDHRLARRLLIGRGSVDKIAVRRDLADRFPEIKNCLRHLYPGRVGIVRLVPGRKRWVENKGAVGSREARRADHGRIVSGQSDRQSGRCGFQVCRRCAKRWMVLEGEFHRLFERQRVELAYLHLPEDGRPEGVENNHNDANSCQEYADQDAFSSSSFISRLNHSSKTVYRTGMKNNVNVVDTVSPPMTAIA